LETMDGASRHVHRVWLRTRFVVKEVSGDILDDRIGKTPDRSNTYRGWRS
jgi:hypothetical protein